ncbi:ABC transporter ATP-binding protein [Anaerocolumna xylanovorans]|uniref:Putative ABC transport system ATP-binding protein n=1 Tax=Anaerocolumna xylanovorans DSM 12503 TaxID=1121345 RepID=A0A1M7YFR3_9FIRM|nr:ABC transporter ATP-binding protein [Anaerocolumna xylanovorans]SHO51453.1 putative ABC transport system ATP-binding protein [Anaerocolumna xylanovorans DSM 12503]
MKALEVSNLTKSFLTGKEEAQVLKGIDFSVDKGEFVSIMGPSGSGKSTLLYLLGGLDKPTGGNIYFEGKDLSTVKKKEMSKLRRTKIGFVFQFYNLVQNLSVEDNIMLPIILDGKNPRNYEIKLTEILETIGLSDKRKQTPRELSGGQQQRVAIARALIADPEIIFLDEPIGNLDSKTGKEIMELFRKINVKYGKTLIQVTHSQSAAQYGTSIIRLVDGEIVEQREVVAI